MTVVWWFFTCTHIWLGSQVTRGHLSVYYEKLENGFMKLEIFEFWCLIIDCSCYFYVLILRASLYAVYKFVWIFGMGPKGLRWVLDWFQIDFPKFEIVVTVNIAFAMYAHKYEVRIWNLNICFWGMNMANFAANATPASKLRSLSSICDPRNCNEGIAFVISMPYRELSNFDHVVHNCELVHLRTHFSFHFFRPRLHWRQFSREISS